ncbi:MAG: acyltransferase family protein [Oscillospiraceae bacterium]|nr:acyltransferase family protein [Oscillospiraceae bacterium]
MGDRLGKSRVQWIDLAKGMTMLLVIAGHSVFGGLRRVIFSFHMPLFFILSGLTYRCSTDERQLWQRCKKAAVHLLVPAAILIGTDILVEIIQMLLDGRASEMDGAYWTVKALTLVFSSGSRFFLGDMYIGRVGIPWFLIALFFGRTLFDLIQLKLRRWATPVCIALTVVGVVVGQWQWLPLSFDVVLASLFFLLLGNLLHRADMRPGALWKAVVAGMVWIGCVFLTWMLDGRYLEMAARSYELFPLCYLTAVAGTLMVCWISVFLEEHLAALVRPFVYIGKHSLELMCVHTLDHLWEGLYQGVSSNLVVTACVRVVVDLLVFMAYMVVKGRIGAARENKRSTV